MGSVEYSERGASLDRLTDKQRRFTLEYPIDHNGVRAAIAAGYSKKGANVQAVKLLNHPIIKKILGKQQLQTRKRLEATVADVLEQLAYCATRSGVDFVDKSGRMIQNINDLPIRAQNAIDGIEQEDFYNQDGEIFKTKIKLKLVGKSSAIDMVMKHLGLYAPERREHLVQQLNWDSLHGGGNGKPVVDPIEARLIEEEQKDGSEKT